MWWCRRRGIRDDFFFPFECLLLLLLFASLPSGSLGVSGELKTVVVVVVVVVQGESYFEPLLLARWWDHIGFAVVVDGEKCFACSRVAKVSARSYRMAAPRRVRVVVVARVKAQKSDSLFDILPRKEERREKATNSLFFQGAFQGAFFGWMMRGEGFAFHDFIKRQAMNKKILPVRVAFPSLYTRLHTRSVVKVNLCPLSLESIQKGPTHTHIHIARV